MFDIEVLGATVYFGGNFRHAGGAARSFAAGADAATGAVTAWNPGFNGPVYDLVVSDVPVVSGGIAAGDRGATAATRKRYMYAGGSFTTSGQQSCHFVGRFATLTKPAIRTVRPARGRVGAIVTITRVELRQSTRHLRRLVRVQEGDQIRLLVRHENTGACSHAQRRGEALAGQDGEGNELVERSAFCKRVARNSKAALSLLSQRPTRRELPPGGAARDGQG